MPTLLQVEYTLLLVYDFFSIKSTHLLTRTRLDLLDEVDLENLVNTEQSGKESLKQQLQVPAKKKKKEQLQLYTKKYMHNPHIFYPELEVTHHPTLYVFIFFSKLQSVFTREYLHLDS